MDFDQAYKGFVEFHVKSRRGNQLERIKSGLGHAEKLFLQNVWWPAFGNFDSLHPEYEIRDYKDGYRYIDFAYIRQHFQIAIEVDGMGPHWKEISDEKFCDHDMRQDHLTIDSWRILRFGYRDVKERPRLCQQVCQQLLGRLTGDVSNALWQLNAVDREILRLALGRNQTLSVKDVTQHVRLGPHAASRHLKGLVKQGWLEPVGVSRRIHRYRLHPSRSNVQL